MNSGTVLAGTEGLTSITLGTRTMPATGAMSRMKLKLSFFIEGRVDRTGSSHEEKRVAIRRRTNNRLGGDIGGRAGAIFYDDWLTKPLRKPLSHHTRDDVVASAGGIPNNPVHRPRRVDLRHRDTRRGRQRGRARGEVQDVSTVGKFHWRHPSSSSFARA